MEEYSVVVIGVIALAVIYMLHMWSRGEVHAKIEEADDSVEEEPTLGFPNESMTKAEIEEAARNLGVELDRRKTKAHMLIDFEQEYARMNGKDLP